LDGRFDRMHLGCTDPCSRRPWRWRLGDGTFAVVFFTAIIGRSDDEGDAGDIDERGDDRGIAPEPQVPLVGTNPYQCLDHEHRRGDSAKALVDFGDGALDSAGLGHAECNISPKI
jgi:hypothetical protein